MACTPFNSQIPNMPFARRLSLLTVFTLLVGCGSLPMRGEAPPSQAFEDTATTTLARLAAASQPPGEAAPSGFGMLREGEFAFDARVALMQRAERSLDLQYYTIHRDHAGRSLLRGLRDAAQRGIRVRLLVDDLYASEIDDLLVGLALYPNAQVRLFNPMPVRRGEPLIRLVMSGNFQPYNRRMHNKLFIADNAVAIFGGRNVADEYFMKNDVANFIDFDAISTGRVVADFSKAFDRYWNSALSWPVHTVLGPPSDAAQARSHFDASVQDAHIPAPEAPTDLLGKLCITPTIVCLT
jgi:putative cardiolipin synthase